MKNELINKIESSFQEKISKIEALTENVTLLSFKEGKIIVKRVNSKTKNIYNYLASQNILNVLFPLKQIVFENQIFFVYKYLNSYDYPDVKKALDLMNVINDVHQKTAFTVRLNDINFKYFMRIYKRLDRVFQTLEMLVRESEMKQEKTDYDWIILSKYKTFLNLKNMMYQLQKKIHKYLDNKGSCVYCLNHGNLSLNHFVQKKLLSFDNGYVGIFVSDFAKLYVSIDDVEGEWFKKMDDIIASYNNDFYKIYFKFLVLYIYVINLKFTSFEQHAILNTYVQIERKVNLFLNLTASYQ